MSDAWDELEPDDEPLRCRLCAALLTEDELDSARPSLECTDCLERSGIAFPHEAHGWCGRGDRHHGGFDPEFSDEQYEGGDEF